MKSFKNHKNYLNGFETWIQFEKKYLTWSHFETAAELSGYAVLYSLNFSAQRLKECLIEVVKSRLGNM